MIQGSKETWRKLVITEPNPVGLLSTRGESPLSQFFFFFSFSSVAIVVSFLAVVCRCFDLQSLRDLALPSMGWKAIPRVRKCLFPWRICPAHRRQFLFQQCVVCSFFVCEDGRVQIETGSGATQYFSPNHFASVVASMNEILDWNHSLLGFHKR